MKPSRKFPFSSLMLAAALLCSLAGCCRDADSRSGSGGNLGTAKGDQSHATSYAMNVIVSTVPFWNDTRATWSAAAEHYGVNAIYGGPIDIDAQKQIDEVESLIARGVSGLVIYPADSAALTPVIDRAVDQGIVVITYLNDAPASKRLMYVTSEWEEASLRLGRAVVTKSAEPQQAIIVYAGPGNEEQEGRRHGFELLCSEYPQLNIVATVSDGFDAAKGTEQLLPLLAKYPNVAYIFGCGSRAAVGAVAALKQLSYAPGRVTVTGWDYDPDALDLIRDGWIQISAAQNSAYMTQFIFGVLEAKSGGFLYPIDLSFAEHGVRPVPEKVVVPVSLVTKDNYMAYYPKVRK